MKAKILVVEDQFVEANNLQRILESAGYTVCPIARSVPLAQRIIERDQPDMVLLDIYLQGNLTGIDLARELKEKNIAFVYTSANSSREVLDAAKATKPYGFLVKPFREKDVLVMLDVAWYLHEQNEEARKQRRMGTQQEKAIGKGGELRAIIAGSQNMLDVLDKIRIVSPTETSVLILGESGTGKELVAQEIHRSSSRSGRPLVVVNCGALPANLIESELFGHEKGAFTGAANRRIGKFELANGGTIFLDEIGELPPDLQVKFLRVLQEREIERIGGETKKVDVRVIAATNRNLEEEIASGRFRLDLYYRLNVFPISVPPLRERKSDIRLLADFFLKSYAKKEGKLVDGFSEPVMKELLDYSWPGNVRELENMMARAVLLSNKPVIDALLLPHDPLKGGAGADDHKIKTMEENERDHIIAVLKKCDWRVFGPGGAAELLNINVSTLNSRMKKLGISKRSY
jgi:DNA-binding NtrC family response regulator